MKMPLYQRNEDQPHAPGHEWQHATKALDGRAVRRGPFSLLGTWLQKRLQPQGRLRLVETLAIGQRRSVALIECDGRLFLAGLGSAGVATLLPLGDTADRQSGSA